MQEPENNILGYLPETGTYIKNPSVEMILRKIEMRTTGLYLVHDEGWVPSTYITTMINRDKKIKDILDE